MIWKERAIIALLFFGLGFIVGWHPAFGSVRNFVVGGLTLGVVIEMVGVFRGWYKGYCEKKSISKSILSEIEINQNRLKPLSDSANKIVIMSVVDWARVGLQQHNKYKEKLPNFLRFDKNIYSNLSDKLGVLNDKCRIKLVQYYSEFEYIEEEYRILDIKRGSYLYLVYPYLRERDKSVSNSKWDEIDEFLRKTKKEYDLGEELRVCLIE